MRASENPFRSEAVDRICYRMPAEALTRLGEEMSALDSIACIIGPEGTGKTTLLEALERTLRKLGHQPEWMRLNESSSPSERSGVLRRLKAASEDDFFLFDGGEVLNRYQWMHLKQLSRHRGFRLLATLHRPRGLPILYETRIDWQVARALVRDLSTEDLEAVAALAFKRGQGNVREVFRACYWACAKKQTR